MSVLTYYTGNYIHAAWAGDQVQLGDVRKFSCSESVLELIMEPVAVALNPRRVFSRSEEVQKFRSGLITLKIMPTAS